jgi:hypothetical protein
MVTKPIASRRSISNELPRPCSLNFISAKGVGKSVDHDKRASWPRYGPQGLVKLPQMPREVQTPAESVAIGKSGNSREDQAKHLLAR